MEYFAASAYSMFRYCIIEMPGVCGFSFLGHSIRDSRYQRSSKFAVLNDTRERGSPKRTGSQESSNPSFNILFPAHSAHNNRGPLRGWQISFKIPTQFPLIHLTRTRYAFFLLIQRLWPRPANYAGQA